MSTVDDGQDLRGGRRFAAKVLPATWLTAWSPALREPYLEQCYSTYARECWRTGEVDETVRMLDIFDRDVAVRVAELSEQTLEAFWAENPAALQGTPADVAQLAIKAVAAALHGRGLINTGALAQVEAAPAGWTGFIPPKLWPNVGQPPRDQAAERG